MHGNPETREARPAAPAARLTGPDPKGSRGGGGRGGLRGMGCSWPQTVGRGGDRESGRSKQSSADQQQEVGLLQGPVVATPPKGQQAQQVSMNPARPPFPPA